MRRWATFGVAVWLVGLVACGAAVTPTAPPSPTASPTLEGTVAVGANPATPPAAKTPTRPSAPTAATPAPATPIAPPVAAWPGNAFLQLIYQGRSYLGFWSRPAANGPTVPAGVGTPELGPPVGRTFSRWQSANLAPAGTAIHTVAGQPPERMLALALAEGTIYYRAIDRPGELERLSVVVGTVREQGEPRWGTPDGSAPPDGDGIYYAPLRLEGVRTIQGVTSIEDGLLDVRQFLAPPGVGNADDAREAFGELVALQPGDTVLAFLWMGADPPLQGTPAVGSWFHWTSPNRLYALRDGTVTPLSVPADANLPGVPEGEFLAGVAEAFQGVTAIDPRDPLPTITPPPTVLPPPRIEAGQELNLAQQYALAGTEWVDVARHSDPRNRYPIVEAEHIATVVAALDRPIAVGALLPQKPPPPDDPRTTVSINFRAGLTTLVTLEYDTASEMIFVRDNFSRRFGLPAPPGFARLLGLE